MHKFTLGLVVAEPEKDSVKQAEMCLAMGGAEAYLFPEGYFKSDRLDEMCELAKKFGKWIFSGMEDTRENGHKFETGVIISSTGEIIGEHKKTSLTKYEIDHGYERGDAIKIIDTELGKIGFAICYEIHFPEIARVLALAGAELILNPIGTGMWHEEQLSLWTSVGKTRASENSVFVAGVSHKNDTIPIAYAYAPGGESLGFSRDRGGILIVNINPEKYPASKKGWSERRPELYGPITAKS